MSKIMTITKELKLFTELTENEQKECIKKNRDSFIYDSDFYMSDYITYDIIPMLNDKGFLANENDIEYDVNYVQGRGANFTCKMFEFNLLLENLNIPHKKWFIDILNSWHVECEIKKIDTFYSHERTSKFVLYFHSDKKRIEKTLSEIEDYIEKLRLDTCISMCDDLTKNYEYYFSDDFIKSDYTDREVYFDSNYTPYYDTNDITEKFEVKGV